MKKSAHQQTEELCQHTCQVLPREDLTKKISRGKPLKIKFGADPTAADLHLGHAVVLSKLRQFQDLGHEVIFLIGDFTAKIGDPSGKSKTRPPLSEKQVKENAQTYLDQVGKVLDQSNLKVAYNSTWHSKLSFADVLKLCGKVTLARITERDDFAKRIKANAPIGFHELLYPIVQGYDSVALEADVELGGTDQTFNLLMGRHLQEQYGQEAQVILTTPLLEGLDGTEKMSKSLDNYVGLHEDASQAYAKLMSISDELMWRYYALLLLESEKSIDEMKNGVKRGSQHPMDLKKEMAFRIVERFWSREEATDGQFQFESLFQQRDYSRASQVKVSDTATSPCWIVDLIKATGAVKSSSEAKRLIQEGSVVLDDEVINDFQAEVSWKAGSTLRVGKKKIYKLM
jgi:tyrosyl-tRNA synthetase